MRAFVFPGQGSQFVGMGKDLVELSHAARHRMEWANALYEGKLLPTMFEGPEDQLRQTYFTQPAIFLCSVILADALAERNVPVAMMAGHSLGEYSALYAAGACDFEPLFELLKLRASLMQKAGEHKPGAMAAVLGLDRDVVSELCAKSGKVVVLANDNAPGQFVISGDPEGVAEVGEQCKAAGARRVLPLNVSGAFHSPLMQFAVAELTAAIEKAPWRDPRVPVVMNVSATPRRTAAEIKADLVPQIVSPVRWTETIQRMVSEGITEFIEIGPGKVLSGLIKRIAPEATTVNIGTLAEVQEFLAKL